MSKINLLTLLCIVVFYCFLPGNISWLNDEPVLIWNALHWNEVNGIAKIGLFGSKAIPFGAVPTIIYQFLLLISANNLITVVILKAIFFVLIIYYSTLQICKTLNFNRNLAFIPLLSPFVFHYSRILWDNCFILPIAFLTFSLVLEQINQPTRRKLIVLFFLSTILIQIHLTSFLLIIPCAIFLLFKQSKWFIENITLTALAVLASFLINYPYFHLLINELPNEIINDQSSKLNFVASGFYYFSGWNFFETFLNEVLSSYLGLSAIIARMISILAIGFYLFYVFLQFCSNLPNKIDPLIQLSLTILIGATIIAYFGNLESFPHYLNALAPVYAVLIIYGMNLILSYHLAGIVNILYVSNMIALSLIFQIYIWQFNGNKSANFGATLSNQIAVMKEIKLSGQNPELITTVKQYQYFPYSYQTLLKILPETNPELSKEKIYVVYADSQSDDGRIIAIKKLH